MGSRLCYQIDATVLASLPLLTAWEDSPLANQVLRESLPPANWQVGPAVFGTGESTYDYLDRVLSPYSAPGAQSWQAVAYQLWWTEKYSGGVWGQAWTDPRQNMVWDFRTTVLIRFFEQPAIVAKYGIVNWPAVGGVTVDMIERDVQNALDHYKSYAHEAAQGQMAGMIVLGIITAGAATAIAAPLIAAAIAATAAQTAAATALALGIKAAVNKGISFAIGELQEESGPTAIQSPAIIGELGNQTTQETAALALPFAEPEALELLDLAKQTALAGEDASLIYAEAQDKVLVAAELARLAGDTDATARLQAALSDTLAAIDNPAGYQQTLGAPAFTDLGAVNYSPLASPAAFSDGLSPAALTGSAQITAPVQASFPWWLLLAVPVTMLAGKKGHTRRRAPSHNRKRSR